MITSKRLQGLFIAAIFSLVLCEAHAQIDEKTYQHKMQLMDSLSFYHMKDYDTLFKISVLYNVFGRNNKVDYYGWINKRDKDGVEFTNTNGKPFNIWKKNIAGINQMPINDSSFNLFHRPMKDRFFKLEFGENYLLSLWLYKKGYLNYSKQLLPKNDSLFRDTDVRDEFGIVYYDAMLAAFTNQRNYPKAIEFGNHLSGYMFKGYKYQQEAIALTRQLKNNPSDFKTFILPDSSQWLGLKQKLNRKEQIVYLADRLRLLNCIQASQPGGIGYDMLQFSISNSEPPKSAISYWKPNARYGVVNPFTELLMMKLNLQETEPLLPYLLSDNYIASYSYFRDFRPERTLHKVTWVANELIFEITGKVFFSEREFDSLSYDQKKMVVDKIKKWCDDNSSFSKEELTITILKTTNQWAEFQKALQTARNGKYAALLPVIVERYNDFKNFYWPVHKHLITETVYELGNEKYIETMKKWSRDTTGIRDGVDLDVALWTSMFLLKYDKGSYDYAMKKLEYVLEKCDGTDYYPKAMDLLLSMHDKRAFKLAEGIINKEGFQGMMYWDYYLNFVKKLLAAKSDYTFNFINERMGSFTASEARSFNNKNGNVDILLQSDEYVLAVDMLRGNKQRYDAGSTFKKRLVYRVELKTWFATQYALLKNGKPNELRLNTSPTEAPVSFVDSPNY